MPQSGGGYVGRDVILLADHRGGDGGNDVGVDGGCGDRSTREVLAPVGGDGVDGKIANGSRADDVKLEDRAGDAGAGDGSRDHGEVGKIEGYEGGGFCADGKGDAIAAGRVDDLGGPGAAGVGIFGHWDDQGVGSIDGAETDRQDVPPRAAMGRGGNQGSRGALQAADGKLCPGTQMAGRDCRD